jgi:hypothetical protein
MSPSSASRTLAPTAARSWLSWSAKVFVSIPRREGEKASIWFPGQTLFIVVTLPSVEVKWLPEQS